MQIVSSFAVHAATPADLPAIVDIYDEVIANSTAVYSLTASSIEERRAWFQTRTSAGYPILVAAAPDGVLGFASFGEFRGAWQGYRYSVEHSVHVREDQRGRGIGSCLIQELFPLAAAMGKHVMIGGIDAANEGSLRLHQRLGFERAAHFREVGRKFGRWLDLVFVQRFLDHPGADRAD